MKNLSCCVYISILAVTLSGCGGEDSTTTFASYQGTTIPSTITATNLNLRTARSTTNCCKNADGSSRTCYERTNESGKCKCYHCDRLSLISTDLTSQCRVIGVSESECKNIIGDPNNRRRTINSRTPTPADKIQSDSTRADNETEDNAESGSGQGQKDDFEKNTNQRRQVIKSNIVKYLERKADRLIINNNLRPEEPIPWDVGDISVGKDLREILYWFKDERNDLGSELSAFWLVDQYVNTHFFPVDSKDIDIYAKYGNPWCFKEIEENIYRWKEEDNLSLDMQVNFDEFIFAVYFFRTYLELAMGSNIYEATGYFMGELYPYNSRFREKCLLDVKVDTIWQSGGGTLEFLEKYIGTDISVLVINNNEVAIAALFKHNDGDYRYYNPNSSEGEITAKDGQDVANRLSADFGRDNYKKLHLLMSITNETYQ
jgi:hypothetical protein